ncbi:MAG: hypothetical protein WED85_09395 [Dehalococcoidia bacterium]
MNVKNILETGTQQALKEMLSDADLAPAVAKRVRALLRDLAREDMAMAMLDLAQLSRAVMASQTPAPGGEYRASVAICSEAGEPLVGICDGPEPGGECPWAGTDGKLPCNGSWLSTQGWRFKVAEDATYLCPLTSLLAQAS